MLGRRRDHDVVPAQLEPVSKVMDSLGRIAAPIRATSVKRAYEPGPVTLRAPPGWADYSSGSFLAGARVFSPRGQGSGWSARSRAAARTNELDAG